MTHHQAIEHIRLEIDSYQIAKDPQLGTGFKYGFLESRCATLMVEKAALQDRINKMELSKTISINPLEHEQAR